MRPGPLFPNADTINVDDEQLPAVMVHRSMHLQISHEVLRLRDVLSVESSDMVVKICFSYGLDGGVRDAVVSQEPQGHQTTASNSASSRA
jgi:hypothetical protein